MYVSDFHAHICIRSKSKSKSRTPELTMGQIASARYVLFNDDMDKITYPLELRVFKSRADIWLTDFYAHLKQEYPSLTVVPSKVAMHATLVIQDEFDIIKFLLMYES